VCVPHFSWCQTPFGWWPCSRFARLPFLALARRSLPISAGFALLVIIPQREVHQTLVGKDRSRGFSRKLASPENSSPIHRFSLWYRGVGLPSEQLLLPSGVARWFPHGPPFAVCSISHASARKVRSQKKFAGGVYLPFAFRLRAEVRQVHLSTDVR
jgi:hypothetical protein